MLVVLYKHQHCRELVRLSKEAVAKGHKALSIALPRMPCETRFGSKVLEMQDLRRIQEAVQNIMLSSVIQVDYAAHEAVQVC